MKPSYHRCISAVAILAWVSALELRMGNIKCVSSFQNATHTTRLRFLFSVFFLTDRLSFFSTIHAT